MRQQFVMVLILSAVPFFFAAEAEAKKTKMKCSKKNVSCADTPGGECKLLEYKKGKKGNPESIEKATGKVSKNGKKCIFSKRFSIEPSVGLGGLLKSSKAAPGDHLTLPAPFCTTLSPRCARSGSTVPTNIRATR